MFCPEGYKTIQAVRNSVADFEWHNKLTNGSTSSDAFEALVFDTILDNDALRVCSPQGVVMKISDEILEQVDILEHIDAKHFPKEHFYNLLDTEIGKKRWSGMPLFFERSHYSVSLTSYREYKKVALKVFEEHELYGAVCLPFEHEPMWQLVESIEGYALCAVENLIPHAISSTPAQERNYLQKTRGRPSNRAKIKDFYQTNFQNGHDSWKQVQNAWVAETGQELSVDTIMRAVKELQRKNAMQK